MDAGIATSRTTRRTTRRRPITGGGAARAGTADSRRGRLRRTASRSRARSCAARRARTRAAAPSGRRRAMRPTTRPPRCARSTATPLSPFPPSPPPGALSYYRESGQAISSNSVSISYGGAAASSKLYASDIAPGASLLRVRGDVRHEPSCVAFVHDFGSNPHCVFKKSTTTYANAAKNVYLRPPSPFPPPSPPPPSPPTSPMAFWKVYYDKWITGGEEYENGGADGGAEPRQVRGGRQLRGAPAGLEWQPSVLQDYGRPRHQHRVWRAADDAAGGGDDGRRVVGLAQGSRPGGSAQRAEPPDEPAPPEFRRRRWQSPIRWQRSPRSRRRAAAAVAAALLSGKWARELCPDDDDDPSDANDENDAGRCRDCRAATSAAVAAAAILTASQGAALRQSPVRRLSPTRVPAAPHPPAATISLQQIRVRKPAQASLREHFAQSISDTLRPHRSARGRRTAARGGRRRSATRSAA